MFKILFYLSSFIAISISTYYQFDLQEGTIGYNIALISFAYLSAYLAFILVKSTFKIKSWIIKTFLYFINWIAFISIVISIDSLPTKGVLSAVYDVIFLVVSFYAIFFTLYTIFLIRKFLVFTLLIGAAISTAVWLILNREPTPPETTPQIVITPIQPWQLNTRYKINAIVKSLKVDLDQDGKEELVAITSYDKISPDVFYYVGFYRYNPATEVWDEFYGDEINILNYGLVKDQAPEKLADYKKALVEMWSKEFTTLENIGDVTGDGCPEIVFSSLIQGKSLNNNIIVAQAGKSSYLFKIATFIDPAAQIVAEDGLLIEKYQGDENGIKDIFQWDQTNLYFKLIETQKTKLPTPIQIPPGLDDLVS